MCFTCKIFFEIENMLNTPGWLDVLRRSRMQSSFSSQLRTRDIEHNGIEGAWYCHICIKRRRLAYSLYLRRFREFDRRTLFLYLPTKVY